jgi:glycine dehydrogenase subunit 2
LDIAKFLIDKKIHPPTVYFPLTVKESIMIEPTETESKETLDQFVDMMIEADELSKTDPDSFHSLPKTTPITRPDEVRAAKDLNTNYFLKK